MEAVEVDSSVEAVEMDSVGPESPLQFVPASTLVSGSGVAQEMGSRLSWDLS